MLNLPVLRWGQPYESYDTDQVKHFVTGETLARVGQANPGLLVRDMKKAQRARDALRAIPCRDLCAMLQKAAELFLHGTLPVGDSQQTPDMFAKLTSGSTGLPVSMAVANMRKNHFVLANMDRLLDALTRGLDLDILTRGYGSEPRGVTVSYQCQTPVLGMVLPSNSPGVHTLWLPVLAMQIGLILKPGSGEPWTPYRVAAACFEAGIPREAVGLYPGGHDMGPEVVRQCNRSMVFGGAPTVAQYQHDRRVQVHGPGYSKILLGDDMVDQWERHLDLMVDSVFQNSGRSCINCSSIWASRHTEEIAQAIAERLGPVAPLPPEDPRAALAAFTNAEAAQGIHDMIADKAKEAGVTDMTARFGPRLDHRGNHAYLRPWVLHCDAPDRAVANSEFMFPFVTVVRCPQERMLTRVGPTLVCTAITEDEGWRGQLLDCLDIDRLNLGPVPTNRIDWLQPHEGNIVEFLFRARAVQTAAPKASPVAGCA